MTLLQQVKWTEDTWRDKKGNNKVTELSEVSDLKVWVISTSENLYTTPD